MSYFDVQELDASDQTKDISRARHKNKEIQVQRNVGMQVHNIRCYEVLWGAQYQVLSGGIRCYQVHNMRCYQLHNIRCTIWGAQYQVHNMRCYQLHNIRCYQLHNMRCYQLHNIRCYQLHNMRCCQLNIRCTIWGVISYTISGVISCTIWGVITYTISGVIRCTISDAQYQVHNIRCYQLHNIRGYQLHNMRCYQLHNIRCYQVHNMRCCEVHNISSEASSCVLHGMTCSLTCVTWLIHVHTRSEAQWILASTSDEKLSTTRPHLRSVLLFLATSANSCSASSFAIEGSCNASQHRLPCDRTVSYVTWLFHVRHDSWIWHCSVAAATHHSTWCHVIRQFHMSHDFFMCYMTHVYDNHHGGCVAAATHHSTWCHVTCLLHISRVSFICDMTHAYVAAAMHHSTGRNVKCPSP